MCFRPRFISIVCVFSPLSLIISDACFSIISFLIQQTSKTLKDMKCDALLFLYVPQHTFLPVRDYPLQTRFILSISVPNSAPSPFESLISISTPDSSPNYNYRSRCQLHSRFKHVRNISPDDVIEIAKFMHSRSMAKELQGTVKEILRTCVSVGCTVDRKGPKDLQQEIVDGDVEIPRD